MNISVYLLLVSICSGKLLEYRRDICVSYKSKDSIALYVGFLKKKRFPRLKHGV